MNTLALEPAYDYALARLHDAAGDIMALPIPLQTLLLVESAQGMIDTGGLEFFYEADFPNHPPYSAFVEAYSRIGADPAAACIAATADMFPFEEPQLFEPLRQLWLEKLCADPGGEFRRLSNRICGDASVWIKLRAYVESHRQQFGPRRSP